jgi:pilus assembly protein CpaE
VAEKILIVDDDVDTLRLVGLMLERQGYTIAAASGGKQALALALKEKPDLILLDMMMPDMDGIEVTHKLRAQESTRDIPIIMFTARDQVDDKILGFEAGVDDYLTKPTLPRELLAHVKVMLERRARAKSPAAPGSTQPVERGTTIGFLSARGGTGVSTLVLNVGVAMQAKYKKDVIVADYRPGQGTISLELGYLKPEGQNHLLKRKPAEIDAQAVEAELTSHHSGVRFLMASPHPKDAKSVNLVDHFEAITRQLPLLARFVMLDLGTSLTPLVEKIVQLCSELIVVIEPVPQSIWQTKALLEELAACGIGDGRISLVLNNRVRSGLQLPLSQVQEQLNRPIAMNFTPAPELAYQASSRNVPMIIHQPDGLTAQQFNKLAELIGNKVSIGYD